MNYKSNLVIIEILQADWNNEILFKQELDQAFDKLEIELFNSQSNDFISNYKTLRYMEYELLNMQNALIKGLKKTGQC